MERAAKLVLAAALGGVLMAVALVSARRGDTQRTETIILAEEPSALPNDIDMRRCRAITQADPDCEAAWEARRRRFFEQGDQP